MKKKLLMMAICLMLLVLVLPAAPVLAATTWYVDDDGGADFTTIQAAIDAASAGDTIIVKDGTYNENLWVDKSLTIQSENGYPTTIVEAADPELDVFWVGADNVTIDGFTAQGCTAELYGGITLWTDGGDTTGCVIRNNHCSNNDCGILLIDSYNTTVESNVASDCRIGIDVGDAGSNLITNNTFSDNDYGISIEGQFAASNTLYLNNFMNSAVSHVLEDDDPPPANFWNSQEQIEYWFDGEFYTGYMGNYWDDYAGTDADTNGIGDTPYPTRGTDADNYPLMGEYAPYFQPPPPDTSASLTATTNLIMPVVGIEVDPDSIDYGDIAPGESSAVETVGITNTGTLDCDVTLEVDGADATAQDFYEQSLYIDGDLYDIATVIASIEVEDSQDVDTQLQVPLSWAEPGVQEATFIFWAEASP